PKFLDLAATSSITSAVTLLQGGSGGVFQLGGSFAVGAKPSALLAGDFNGDNLTDLATANTGTNDVSVLLSNGAGTFQSELRFAAGAQPFGLAAADFNGDGKLDLATGNTLSVDPVTHKPIGTVTLLPGIGGGQLQQAQKLRAPPVDVVEGDF